jgi:hypothetical protein
MDRVQQRLVRGIMRAWLGSASLAACVVFIQHHVGAQTAPSDWTVAVSTSCEAMVPDYCQGRFGFRITAGSAFLVGPNPDGRSFSGYLRKDEGRELYSAAEQVLAGINAQSVECHVYPEIPGVAETVVILAKGRTVVLRGAGGRLGHGCAPGDALADARLFTLADRLMRQYYPKPF